MTHLPEYHERRELPREAPSPFRANFLDLLRLAADQNASDLHIEPRDGVVRVRVRVDGNLRLLQEIKGAAYIQRFIQEAKKICRFDTGKLNVPQDQRLRVDVIAFDLRASLIPTLYGEKIVLRLLQRGKQFSLQGYSMPEAAKTDLRQALDRWQGLILITGPTGSGKTTLLYSALGSIDAEENNIHTLEDPVEYELPGISQSSVSPIDMSFAGALRALMRQDPDVIMVGEIRDEETAKAAIHAASTGHLVLSTIHANSAVESVKRLEDLGMSRDQVVSNLLYASAQRLVPQNCPACAEPDVQGQETIMKVLGHDVVPKISRGCAACGGTGTKGRVLLFEYLTFQPDPERGTRVHRQHGSLKEHAFSYLKQGIINVQNACAFE